MRLDFTIKCSYYAVSLQDGSFYGATVLSAQESWPPGVWVCHAAQLLQSPGEQQRSCVPVRRSAQEPDTQSVCVGLQLHRGSWDPQLCGAGQRQEETPQVSADAVPAGDGREGRASLRSWKKSLHGVIRTENNKKKANLLSL